MRYFRLRTIDNEDGTRDTEVLERKAEGHEAIWWQGHGIFFYREQAVKYIGKLGVLCD